jgi:hypothetical protein
VCNHPAVRDVPYFLWSDDDQVTEAELREHLRAPDARERALWEARVMREARYGDVWKYLALDDVLRDWELIERHLGRMRAFWQFLLKGWRDDGLLPTHR